jgi:hypothetical protein
VKDDAAYIAAQIQTLADRQIQTLADRRKARPNPANHEHPIRAEAQEES